MNPVFSVADLDNANSLPRERTNTWDHYFANEAQGRHMTGDFSSWDHYKHTDPKPYAAMDLTSSSGDSTDTSIKLQYFYFLLHCICRCVMIMT